MEAYDKLEELQLHYDFEHLSVKDQHWVLEHTTIDEYQLQRELLLATRQELANVPIPPSDLQTQLQERVAQRRTIPLGHYWRYAAALIACCFTFGLGWWLAEVQGPAIVEKTTTVPIQTPVLPDTVFVPQVITEYITQYITRVERDTVYLNSDTVYLERPIANVVADSLPSGNSSQSARASSRILDVVVDVY